MKTLFHDNREWILKSIFLRRKENIELKKTIKLLQTDLEKEIEERKKYQAIAEMLLKENQNDPT